MVMSGHFQKSLNLGEWDICFDTIDERAKTLPRVLKGKGGAMLKALVTGE
jgi:ribose 5-phosphate isomerase